jgi:putative ABC transport system ATP-binding protein
MGELIMRTENVTRVFKSGQDTIYALKNVTVEIPKSKLTIFRGRSGSGKTTLLNILSGLDKPTEGKVFFEEREITSVSDLERDRLRAKKMGFVFQSIALMPDMNALENVEYGLRISGKLRKKTGVSAAKSLKLVGLDKRAKHLASELSGGEQQRVAIARSFVHNPEILFADEPTAELDTAMGIQVVDIFKRLIQEKGLTVVMTTHDPHMIELADCIYTLSDGVIVDGDD